MSDQQTSDHAWLSAGDPDDICARLRRLAPDVTPADAALAREAAAEIGRLRAVIRVNALRYDPTITHEQINEAVYGKR